MKGFNTTIKINDIIVAAQTNASLQMTAGLKDVSDLIKLEWEEHISYRKSWTMRLDGAYIIDGTGFTALKEAFVKAKPVKIELSSDEGKFGGQAIITHFDFKSPFNTGVDYSISVKGVSSLGRIV